MSSEKGWVLRRPLQIESLRQTLPESEETEKYLRKLQHLRENLDAVVYALSNHHLASDRREHLLEILRRNQQELEACFVEMGFPPRSEKSSPLWHFNQLDPVVRNHLAVILGVMQEPPFYAVLEIKAEEYLLQQKAFSTITQSSGFRPRQILLRHANKAALALTLSGSLIQISSPLAPRGARRYIYQNIYGNAHPPEGILVLDRDIEVGHRIRSVELTTSPVRLLYEANRKMSWKDQSQTFAHISRALSSLGSRSGSQLAAVGWRYSSQTGLVRLANLTASERVFKQEYGQSLDRFLELRVQFKEASEVDGRPLEAELLTLCHYLQAGARELGFDARPLPDITEFTTEEDDVYRPDPEQQGSITLVPHGKGPEVLFVNVSVGRQLVSQQAPLALIGQGGGVVEVTLPVVKLHRR
jgi:hypothetical protein